MKDVFPGYYKKKDEDLKILWNECIICFDANVLLNLYRYSSETQDALLNLITKIQEKVVLPHQAALEYNRNRYDVISEQEKAYKEFLSKLKLMQKDMESTSKPPFLSKKVHKTLLKNFTEVEEEIESNLKIYNGFFKDDLIYNKLSEIFRSKISVSFTNDDLDILYKDGEKRYEKKIPPGYEDIKKSDMRKYGDWILWKQILNLSLEKKKSIILISDEKKEDWWWKINDGRTMGPRHELVDELKAVSGMDFHMYSSERFLSFGQLALNEKINERAVDEIKEFNKIVINRVPKRFRNITDEYIQSKPNLSFKWVESPYVKANSNLPSEQISFFDKYQDKLKILLDQEGDNFLNENKNDIKE